jgi:hypothetical protein
MAMKNHSCHTALSQWLQLFQLDKGMTMNITFKLVKFNGEVIKTFDSFELAHNYNTKVCYGSYALYMVSSEGFGKKLYDSPVFEITDIKEAA